jgi:hypothetical protein
MVRKRQYQRSPRFTKRLEVKFSSGVLSYKGISSNLSENGIFIRTNRGFAPDTTIDIELVLPDNKLSKLKGIVRRTIKTTMSTLKNGMGVEFIERDDLFINFMKSFSEGTETETEKTDIPEFQIISCSNCGVKNKVLSEKLSLKPKCGRCGTPLITNLP